jgi:hypothetical protein
MATLALLVVAFSASVEAQQGAMSAAQVAQIKQEVADAVHTYLFGKAPEGWKIVSPATPRTSS